MTNTDAKIMREAGSEPDAYGRTGEKEHCWVCDGKGVDFGQTCLTCGGLGWFRRQEITS